MNDHIALITIMAWPVVPLFWIPVHLMPHFFRRVKVLTYAMPLITWLPIAYLIYHSRGFLLHYNIAFPLLINLTGWIFFVIGTLLHIWTAKLLGLRGLMGLPEIHARVTGKFVATGAFSVVRHPTYLAHSMIFSGVFLLSGVAAVGVVTVLDFLIIHTIIIPLEEKELLVRFGDEFRKYRDKVPRFFPRRKRVNPVNSRASDKIN